jgi:hypothetical protein
MERVAVITNSFIPLPRYLNISLKTGINIGGGGDSNLTTDHTDDTDWPRRKITTKNTKGHEIGLFSFFVFLVFFVVKYFLLVSVVSVVSGYPKLRIARRERKGIDIIKKM